MALRLRNGNIVSMTYDSGRHVIEQQMANGDVVRYTRDALGRVDSFDERGHKTQLIRTATGKVAGTASGRNAADVERMLHALGVTAPAAYTQSPISYDADGRAIATALLNARVTYAYDGDNLTQTLRTDAGSVSMSRTVRADGVRFTDTLGADYTLRSASQSAYLLDASGRDLAHCEYDSAERVQRLTVGALVIDYAYADGSAEWTRKTLRLTDGRVIRDFVRTDYPDPLLDSQSHGELRAATGDAVAVIENGAMTFTAKANPLQVSVDATTMRLAYRSFRFPAKSDYSDDEIRILPDGSGLLLPSLPHGEGTGVARSVRAFKVDIPASWLSRSARAAAPLRTTTTSAAHRLPIAPNYYYSITDCEYVPGGSVTVENQTTDYPGYWECTTYSFWEPDPSPGPVGGGGTPGTGPATSTQSQKVSDGSSLAQSRLCDTQTCAQLFQNLGTNGVDMINGTNYLDGRSTSTCMQHPDWAAWTNVGDCNVYLCDAFTTLSQSGAATILIHEALHDAGMSENPPDPCGLTSSEINDLVQSNCDLTW